MKVASSIPTLGFFFSSLPPVFLFLQERFKDHFSSCILEIIKAWVHAHFFVDAKEQLCLVTH
jgi:hypothetical protein